MTQNSKFKKENEEAQRNYNMKTILKSKGRSLAKPNVTGNRYHSLKYTE